MKCFDTSRRERIFWTNGSNAQSCTKCPYAVQSTDFAVVGRGFEAVSAEESSFWPPKYTNCGSRRHPSKPLIVSKFGCQNPLKKVRIYSTKMNRSQKFTEPFVDMFLPRRLLQPRFWLAERNARICAERNSFINAFKLGPMTEELRKDLSQCWLFCISHGLSVCDILRYSTHGR